MMSERTRSTLGRATRALSEKGIIISKESVTGSYSIRLESNSSVTSITRTLALLPFKAITPISSSSSRAISRTRDGPTMANFSAIWASSNKSGIKAEVGKTKRRPPNLIAIGTTKNYLLSKPSSKSKVKTRVVTFPTDAGLMFTLLDLLRNWKTSSWTGNLQFSKGYKKNQNRIHVSNLSSSQWFSMCFSCCCDLFCSFFSTFPFRNPSVLVVSQ